MIEPPLMENAGCAVFSINEVILFQWFSRTLGRREARTSIETEESDWCT